MDHTFQITYAHCTKATAGQPDRYPFTEYEFRTVDALMYRCSFDPIFGLEDQFDVEVNGKRVASGDTKEDAVGFARYWLMDASRTAAEQRSAEHAA